MGKDSGNYVPYYEAAEDYLEAAHLALEILDLQLPPVRKTAEEIPFSRGT
ncbi:hypothetical protein DAPPUDRAFT_334581 [Daphnia pulex]|uniref:Uncharacterized protein n=1 Tax=Daphnia pulex TaxID=6669 RepID=E9HVW5_DAPPU|nr:hypothetical protein DAPPUDRAFT_334581 [Daphnia pulex]|eukprot:EFX64108.1 hypothetical protein DAPPUDRAFT_334581 [Daphnia pulex]